MGNKKITLSGSELKEYMLDKSLDRENKCKLSVRKFLAEYGVKIGMSTYPNSFTYWAKKMENYKPYYGERVNDELIWQYAIDNRIFDQFEVPLEEFKNRFNKVTKTNFEEKVFRAICSELGEGWDNKEFTYNEMKDYIKEFYGDDTYSKLYFKHKERIAGG